MDTALQRERERDRDGKGGGGRGGRRGGGSVEGWGGVKAGVDVDRGWIALFVQVGPGRSMAISFPGIFVLIRGVIPRNLHVGFLCVLVFFGGGVGGGEGGGGGVYVFSWFADVLYTLSGRPGNGCFFFLSCLARKTDFFLILSAL